MATTKTTTKTRLLKLGTLQVGETELDLDEATLEELEEHFNSLTYSIENELPLLLQKAYIGPRAFHLAKRELEGKKARIHWAIVQKRQAGLTSPSEAAILEALGVSLVSQEVAS